MTVVGDLYRTEGPGGCTIVHRSGLVGIVIGFFDTGELAAMAVRALDVFNPDERPVPERFRVGRSVGRTVYRMTGVAASKDDALLGHMITCHDAEVIVAALNQYTAR